MFSFIKPYFENKSAEFFVINLCFLLIVWVLFIATPFDIMVSNPDDFADVSGVAILLNGFTYGFMTFVGLNISLCFVFVIFIGVVFFLRHTKYLGRALLAFFITLTICIWINSIFLVGEYGVFDGRGSLQIEPFGLLSWVQISLFCFVVIVTFFLIKNSYKIISYTLGIMLIISLITGIINVTIKVLEKKIEKKIETSYYESFFQYSKNNNNLLYILLDEYQSDFFQYILNDNLKKELAGFIWYKDTAANFPTTKAATAAIFTGEVYDNTRPILDYLKDKSSVTTAKKFLETGGKVDFTGSTPYSSFLFPGVNRINIMEFASEFFLQSYQYPISIYSNLINFSLFRASPEIFKRLIYNNEKWLVKLPINVITDVMNKIPSLHALNHIASHKITALDNYPSTFKFDHSILTHSPTFLYAGGKPVEVVAATLENKSAEGKLVINLVVDIIKKLKKAKVFDNTMIIISSDHGSSFTPESFKLGKFKYPYSRAAATLLIKPLHQYSEFEISNYPAQLSDIAKTIGEAFSFPVDYPGVDLLNNSKINKRHRIYNFYTWDDSWGNQYLPNITQFSIDGPIRSYDSWKKFKRIKKITSAIPLSKRLLNFSDVRDNEYYNPNGLSGREAWGRWSDGTDVEIDFKLEQGYKVKAIKFNLKAFIAPKNVQQTANVFIDNQLVGKININLGEVQPKTFIFDFSNIKTDTHTVHFYIEKPVSPISVGVNPDQRELGLGFVSMELL